MQILLKRHGTVLRQHYGAISEAALGVLISEVLGIVSKVVADERALAH
jgi:hypothetical protein